MEVINNVKLNALKVKKNSSFAFIAIITEHYRVTVMQPRSAEDHGGARAATWEAGQQPSLARMQWSNRDHQTHPTRYAMIYSSSQPQQ